MWCVAPHPPTFCSRKKRAPKGKELTRILKLNKRAETTLKKGKSNKMSFRLLYKFRKRMEGQTQGTETLRELERREVRVRVTGEAGEVQVMRGSDWP